MNRLLLNVLLIVMLPYTQLNQFHRLYLFRYFNDLPKLSKENSQNISLGELHCALLLMCNGKAPGIDAKPVEFYKTFWHALGIDLYSVLLQLIDDGILPHSCITKGR